MKTFFPFAAIVGGLLLAGCVSAPPPDLAGSGPQVGELTIVSATYGSGDRVADVTARVEKRLHMDIGEFYVSPEWLKADPTPGWNKELIINYDYAGKRIMFHAGEHSRVTYKMLLDHALGRKPVDGPA